MKHDLSAALTLTVTSTATVELRLDCAARAQLSAPKATAEVAFR